ncbi:hypothetical protein [Shimazuella kribbensis]|uniref:hypothetical protein n=1 Tax=Shimazuella kribbensis TaxID=139808 RepID=UPI0012ECA320|nr:hypothetical protein [Shimazuella kribbensis]
MGLVGFYQDIKKAVRESFFSDFCKVQLTPISLELEWEEDQEEALIASLQELKDKQKVCQPPMVFALYCILRGIESVFKSHSFAASCTSYIASL